MGDHFHALAEEIPGAGLGVALEGTLIHLVEALGNDQLQQPLPQGIVAGDAEAALGRGVERQDAPGAVHADEAVQRRVGDGAVLQFAGAQGLLGLLALGDLAAEHQDAVDTGQGHALERDIVPVQAAVAVAPVPLEALRLAGRRPCEEARRLPGGIGLVAGAEGVHVQPQHLLVAVADGRTGPRVGIHQRAAVDVQHQDGVLGAGEDRPVARLGLQPLDLRRRAHGEDAQHRLGPLALLHRPHPPGGDQPQRAPVAGEQRVAGVAVDPIGAEHRIPG